MELMHNLINTYCLKSLGRYKISYEYTKGKIKKVVTILIFTIFDFFLIFLTDMYVKLID